MRNGVKLFLLYDQAKFYIIIYIFIYLHLIKYLTIVFILAFYSI